jgi:hypothetical protein
MISKPADKRLGQPAINKTGGAGDKFGCLAYADGGGSSGQISGKGRKQG